MLRSKFIIGADAAAAAGPVGRHASASTDVLLNAELLSYSRSKGVFAGVDLNGAVVSQNSDDTNIFYGGKAKSFTEIDSNRAISTNEVLSILEDPKMNVSLNLLDTELADQPAFFGQLLPSLRTLRSRTGRPPLDGLR